MLQCIVFKPKDPGRKHTVREGVGESQLELGTQSIS